MGNYEIMGIAWAAVIFIITLSIMGNRKTHPKALFLLFFAEFWERFSYYGMRALLVLYMVDPINGMGKDEGTAFGMYAAYGSMVYATPIIGGLVAEKLFGYRKAILWGGVLMAAGHFAMAFESETIFLLALALLILGNGFFKPSVSSFLAEFYDKDDPRKDGAYTLFYMGINAGAMLSGLTCGVIGEDPDFGWHYGFGLAGIGMVLGLFVFLFAQWKGTFGDKGHSAYPERLSHKTAGLSNEIWIYIASLLSLLLFKFLVEHNSTLDYGLGALAILMLGYLISVGVREKENGTRMYVITILLLFTALFWTFFELAGSAISLYTLKNVDRFVGGQELATSMFQSVNPAIILLFAPAFSWMWGFLRKRNMDPSSPVKFAIGLVLLGGGFFAFTLGEGFAINGMVPLIFLILAYLLHTFGELCLSPVGLSLVTKLSPAHMVGMIMGIWFLSSAIAHQAGGAIAKMTTESAVGDSHAMTAVESLTIYTDVFTNIGLVAVASGVLLFVISPLLKKWMAGVH